MARAGRITVLLRGLAEAADLRLRVLVGEDALDRPVDGVFTTDLLDPRRYLTGGEIVLTGLMWRRAPGDSESFVAAVTAAGAVALAAGDAALGSVPDDLVAACRRHGLPLFEVPVDVSFAAITEQVLAARLGLSAGPGPAVARLRALATGRGRTGEPGAGDGAAPGLAEVFAVAAREYGVPGWVLSAAGRLVAGAAAAPSSQARAALASAWLGAAALPVTVLADGVPYSLFGVTGEPAHRLAGWFVALAGDQAGWDADRRGIAAELAAAAAGHRARHEEAQRAVRRAADDALRQVLDHPPGDRPDDPQAAAALRRCGLATGRPLVAVALTAGPARPDASGPGAALPGAALPGTAPPAAGWPQPGPGEPVWPQAARVLLEEMLPAAVAGVSGREAVALCPGGGEVLDRIRDVAGTLAGTAWPGATAPGQYGTAPGVPGLAFGVSVLPAGDGEQLAGTGPGTPPGWTVAGLARAVARARQARRIAALLGGGVRVVDAAGLGSVELLLATAPAEARRAFRASLLSPLLDYDADHGAELVRTLRVFLDCSGSWTKAAGAMFVHVNSLRYRIRRVEELTGRDLGSLADQAALLLALRLAGPGSAEDQGTDPGGGGAVEGGEFPAG
jgi:Purine catabolism regulatory protein-like family/PucR C-terminal helix-turn-helix domain